MANYDADGAGAIHPIRTADIQSSQLALALHCIAAKFRSEPIGDKRSPFSNGRYFASVPTLRTLDSAQKRSLYQVVLYW
jgi:hypothetical protein